MQALLFDFLFFNQPTNDGVCMASHKFISIVLGVMHVHWKKRYFLDHIVFVNEMQSTDIVSRVCEIYLLMLE